MLVSTHKGNQVAPVSNYGLETMSLVNWLTPATPQLINQPPISLLPHSLI